MRRPLPAPIGASETPVKVANFGSKSTIVYFVVVGPGIVRLGTSKEELMYSSTGTLQDDGLPQAVGNGEVKRLWAGDLWASSSAGGTFLIVVAPEYVYNLNSGTQPAAV